MISRFLITKHTTRCTIFTRVANFCRKVLSREESMANDAIAQPHMSVIPREQHNISAKISVKMPSRCSIV